jgi:hypothetical protein
MAGTQVIKHPLFYTLAGKRFSITAPVKVARRLPCAHQASRFYLIQRDRRRQRASHLPRFAFYDWAQSLDCGVDRWCITQRSNSRRSLCGGRAGC